MEINTSVIAWLLNRKFNFESSISFSGEKNITAVRFLEEGEIQENVLYFLQIDSSGFERLKNKNASFVTFEGSFMEELKGENICNIQKPLKGKDIIQTALAVFQTIGELFTVVSELENKTLKEERSLSDLNEYIYLISEIFPFEFLCVDTNLEILGAGTQNAENYFGVWDGESDEENRFTELIYGPDYQHNCSLKEPFVLYSPDKSFSMYCRNFFKNGKYAGAILACENVYEEYDACKAAAVEAAAGYLEPFVFEKIESRSRLGDNAKIHDYLQKCIEEESFIPQKKLWAELLEPYGVYEDDSYCAVKLSFFEGLAGQVTVSYVSRLLEEQWIYSFAVFHDDDIYWIINLSRHKISAGESFKKLILNTVNEYICRAGISNSFSGLENIKGYIFQADKALEIGLKKAPHLWYHTFEMYAFDYILSSPLEVLSTQQVSHKGLLNLFKYDKEHSTTYVNSLETYFHCQGNTTKAASELFLHRTSLVRQLDRIEKITGYKLHSSYEEDMYLQISLMLLEKTYLQDL